MAEDSGWLLKEDGYLNVDCEVDRIIYISNLNILLVFLQNNSQIKILDVNSGVVLQKVTVTATTDGTRKIKGKYLSEQDKILFWDDKNLGLRGDYNGVLLLDTILQTPVTHTEEIVKIELLLSEAVLFLQSLQSLEQHGVENSADVINELTLKISEAHSRSQKGIKAQKWETVCLELPHSSLKVVASTMVMELKRLQRHIPALAISSALNERLTDLTVGARIIENDTTQRFHMFSEAARRKTFEQWPHMDYKWALPDQMAQAGFYHQPSDSGDDRAMCFTCNVCLVCWEKTDEPWSEHERHSPECPFVKGEYTQNVPLSVTYASSPAVPTKGFNIMSTGDQGNILCVGNQETGEIGVWNVEKQLKNSVTFNIKSCEIIKKIDLEDIDINLSALCTFKKHTVLIKSSSASKSNNDKNTEVFGTRIIAGVKMKSRETKQQQEQQQSVEEQQGQQQEQDPEQQQIFQTDKYQLALIVYAVTEVAKTAKNNASTANGNNNGSMVSMSHSNNNNTMPPPPTISTILQNPKSTLDTIEERFEDDFLKFFENDSLLLPKSKTDKADFLFNVKKKLQMGGKVDGNSQTASGGSASGGIPVEENDVICTPIQIIPIVPFLFVDYEISEMLPSFDNKYLLVVLKRTGAKTQTENEEPMETDDNIAESGNRNVQLILFSIGDSGFINENPNIVRILEDKDTPVEISMLPKLDTSGRLFSGSPADSENGLFVITCVDGSIKILSLTTLKTLSEARVEGQKFVSSVYCKNLERLCGCTDKGSLHFYSFYDLDIDSSDEYDEEAGTNDSIVTDESMNQQKQSVSALKDEYAQFDNATPSTSANFIKKEEEKRHNSEIIAYRKQLTLHDLKILYSLTLFDEMLTPYSAEVPGCWNELVQAQKQRRNPQHLRPGDDTHLTRTWRLHNDATTWDEHLIELSLPKTTSLGHIDFKFSLYQPCSNPPAIQVTLLKQKSIGLCCRRKTPANAKQGTSASGINAESNSCDVDDNIDFNINSSSNLAGGSGFSSVENPVLSEEYLQARNAEILAGPIELSSCMDLSEQGGIVTLISPKLLKSKARNYLLHIKTMADVSKDGQGKTRVPVRKKGLTSVLLTSFTSSFTAKEPPKERVTYVQDPSNAKSNSNDYYIGCDWLHEISITVRATREAPNLTNERVQRLAMLESNLLTRNLLKIAENKDNVLMQNLALDILTWILSVRMARYRCPRNVFQMKCSNVKTENVGDTAVSDINLQQSECIKILEDHLSELLKNCILLNNRSVAHKCVKLVIIGLNGAQNMMDQQQSYSFEVALKNAILDSVPNMIRSNYAGALRWFSILIAGTSTAESQGVISTSLIKLLIDILNEISNRPNPLNSLLQARFGLYLTPFESELFDSDLTALNKNNCNFSYAPVLKSASGTGQNSQLSDLKSFCVADGSGLRIPLQLRRKSISNHFKGLLEVEPIHYVCCSTSEATRIENMDSISIQSTNIIDDILVDAPPNAGVVKLGTNVIKLPNEKETKNNNQMEFEKIEIGLSNNVKHILVDKIFLSQLKKHKYKDLKDELLASVKSVEKLSSIGMSMFTNDESTPDSGWGPNFDMICQGNGETSARFSEDGADEIFNSKADLASAATFSNKIKDFIEQTNKEDNSTILPWHKMLSAPSKQMIVVDRMHSGARRQVTLDFGYPVLLTDVIIPCCADLASLTLDIWCFEEETDSVRLAVSQDIGVKYLILSDLQPPPVCRYVKVTFTGRYGMSATRCKIPMGSFYGHVVILDKESYADPVMKYVQNKKNHIRTQLKVLNALYEDTHCRYCLSSSKLSELLQPLLKSENSNMAHMQSYLNRMKENEEQSTEYTKILTVYEECIAFQNQLNIVKNVIKRLETASVPEQTIPMEIPLKALCTDKLRVLSECLVESLLHFIINYGGQNVSAMHSFFDLKTCNLLFKTLVVRGDSHLQLATCSLLVRMCCFQPWWGEFFANTFTTLFSSQNCEIFPQDRVFFLLTYLGRKSIYMGTCRTIVIDAILKTIASLLAPLSSNYDNRMGVWRSTDLILLSWLLLFLSVCLYDNNDKKESNNPRWDFMSGEADMVKARLSMNNNNSKTFSRSFKKRFLQNKTNNIAEKFYMMSDASFEQQYKNEAKKIQNSIKLTPYEYFAEFGKNVVNKKSSDTSNKSVGTSGSGVCAGGIIGSSSSSSSNNTSAGPSSTIKCDQICDNMPDTAFDRGLKSIKGQHMLVVIRGLIGLLLNMDFTCNMDLFLLTCKIIARLVNACPPAVQLSSIMTTTQLLQLIRIAVWENQQHPWTVHAITCLLQDILEADKNSKMGNMDDNVAMEIDSNVISEIDMQRISELQARVQPATQNSSQGKDISYAEAAKYQLPSLMECEDAEMEDILDDILEQAKKFTSYTKKDGNYTPVQPNKNYLTVSYRSRVSSTMDARLEYGLDTSVEMTLRRLTTKSSVNLFASLPQFGNKDTVNVNSETPTWPDHILNVWSGTEYQQTIDTNKMLMDVFENIFMDLHLEDSWLNLEQVLQLWLSLNGEVIDSAGNCNFNAAKLPKIPFGEKAVHGLLKALATHPNIQIRGWCLGFQCLIYASKPILDADTEFGQTFSGINECYMKKIGSLIVNNEHFERMLLRFLSESDKNNSLNTNRYAGPTICRLLIQLFSHLQKNCDVSVKLKEIVLRVLLHLIQYDGAITKQQGPIDAQSKFIIEILKYNFLKTDLSVAMSIIESVSQLAYNHITNDEKISCQKSSESSNATNNVFGSLFATVLGSESSQSKTVTDTTLLVNLLKLSSILIHTKVPQSEDENIADGENPENASNMPVNNESQTDEIKADQQNVSAPFAVPRPVITFADKVLQHYPTMSKLLGTLSHCSNSSFAMFVISSYSPFDNDSKNTLSDPQNVADALFQLLIYLNKLASEPVLVIKPLFDYLNFVSNARHAMPKLQLSEPFLWFILKVLESPYAVEIFCEMGGIKILSENLVRSNRTLVNMQPNLVTMIMQHLSKSQNIQSLSSTAKKTGTTTTPATSSTKNEEGLINFAPFCTITSENPSAQPADVLIQGPIASHRRARTPAWSYLFYPYESHVDLTMTLPTAVLLKEIQLQPHLSTLASCPSAVAIEVTRDPNLGPIPITQPIYTVGMTCIRLKFTQPEIATHIIIRLYRPKDSASIGLTQISVLGTTIFSDIGSIKSGGTGSFNNNSSGEIVNEDDSLTKTSLGWLRILAQCFNAACFDVDQNLTNMVISSASDVNGFLEACCSLLNIAPSTPNFSLQNLESVLLKLGLHSRELGLKLIDILLNESIPQMFKMCNESISDLLYQLCTTSDNYSKDRVQFMLNWLQNLRSTDQPGTSYSSPQQIINPNSGYIKCLASILWQCYATNLIVDLPNMITLELFEIVYKWLQEVPESSPTKTAIDAMLCSICCVRPEFFTLLLKKMQILVPNLSNDLSACISDDRKDNESMTDDNKQQEYNSEEWYGHYTIQSLAKLDLSSSQLNTVAMSCQSPLAIYQLIDSGLPNLFTSAILEFCHRMSNRDSCNQKKQAEQSLTDADKANISGGYPMVTVIKITEILDFLSQICSEGHMRDWLGSYEGSVFWEPLLTLLCNNKLQGSFLDDETTNQPYLELEETVIKFLSNVTACHPKNQDTLTTNLISVIRTTERNNYNININNVLNKNFEGQSSSYSSPLNMKYSISGFTRRLVLQILLESEKIAVSVRSDFPLQRKEHNIALISNHPSKKANSHHWLFYISINTRCQDILEHCASVYNNLMPAMNSESRQAEMMANNAENARERKEKELWDWGLGMNLGMEFLSVAAGVTAKDKRLKEVKNQANSLKTKDLFSVFKLKPDEVKNLTNFPECSQLVHPACPDILITRDTTIAQILTMIKTAGLSLSTPCINLNFIQSKLFPDDINCEQTMKASDFVPLPSPLQIFSSRGGLSLLAHYLPTVYPEQPKTQQKMPEKDKSPPVVGENWVKIEPNDEIYEDVDDSLAENSAKMPIISSVPQHSLAAFGLFLKLPAYSEVLLRDKVRAQCLLRLILGVTGDGEGNDIYSLALSSSLPTLPFEVFRQLLDSSPLTTDDGVLLRRMVVEVGAVHLVLNCLSIFTHHNSNLISAPEIPSNSIKTPSAGGAGEVEQTTSDDKSHVYWAKGTGFGTGSTQQSWNVEQALMRQKSEEEHVTVLLQVLSAYINPGDVVPSNQCDPDNINYRDSCDNSNADLPPLFLELLQQSCLIPALCSYLRNDSVLDITRHIPLYRAILQLLRALSLSNQLVQLLMKQDNDGRTSIATLLYNMKSCVDTYASRLKINKKSNLKGQTQKISISLDDSDDEGLALLIPDIQETTTLVQSATYSEILTKEESQQNMNSLEYQMNSSIEQKYLEVMKKLQFDTFEMIVESENGYRFTVSHHFETNVRMSGDHGHPARVKRLAQETVTLSTSLPLSYSSSVFVRCDTDRLDIMKVLITGPADTPYANGCFEFDVYFPHDYPNSPMMINLETTGRHSVRFNPNLYNDGKVCLSVLNTWHGRPEEKWNAQTSSFLQVLVSIQSLILVPEPYFNEPGFERSRGTPSGTHSSREYNSNIYQACVKWAMLEQLKNPCPCFKEVIHTHFWLKRNEICQQIENWIAELSRPQYSERGGRTITFNSMVLRRQYRQLREELAKLPVPEGLEHLDHPFSANVTTTASTTPGTSSNTNTTTSSSCSTVNSSSSNSAPLATSEFAIDFGTLEKTFKSEFEKEDAAAMAEMYVVEKPIPVVPQPAPSNESAVFNEAFKSISDFDIEDEDDEYLQMHENTFDTLIDDVIKSHKNIDNMLAEDISE